MFFNDHAPAHFHVQYAEYKATVDIESLTLSSGELPRRAQELVLDWAELHQKELLEDWRLCMDKQQPKPIEPLK
jgi:hypothetical protein